MTRTVLALFALGLVCWPAVAQDKSADPPPAPKSPPPMYGVAQMKDGKLRVEIMVPVAMTTTEQREKVVLVNGQQMKVTYQVNVLIYRTELRAVPNTTGATFYTADGHKLTADRAAKILTKETTCLLALDGRPVDPTYLRVIQPGTVVIVLPQDAFADNNWGKDVPDKGDK